MYHNLIPITQRPKYLDLLSKAERLLPTLLIHPEHLPIVIEAASAVRGSEEVIARIKKPLNAQHLATLSALLTKSRTYVSNFWDIKDSTPSSDGTKPTHPINPTNSKQQPTATVQNGFAVSVPNTPDTLRQYLPTLSSKLQRQAEMLPAKYAELNDLHETLDHIARFVYGNTLATKKDATKEISYYAKRIDLLVRTIDAFWLRVHAERQAQAGQPITKEYKTYLDEEEKKYPMEEAVTRRWGDYSKTEIEQLELSQQDPSAPIFPNQQDAPTIAQLVYARQERNKKLIRRAPQHISEGSRRERILAMNELHEWGIPIERKQWEVLRQMGIEVPKDYLNPFLTMTPEEKKAHKQTYDKERYEQNKPLEVKLGIKRKIRKSKQDDNPYLKKE